MKTYKFSADKKIIFSPQLSQLKWLAHATSTRLFDSVAEDKPAELKRFVRLLKLNPRHFAFGKQTHSDRITVIDEAGALSKKEDFSCFPANDGLITAIPNIMISVFTADCLPIFIVDNHQRVIGLVHAGWKGTLKGITQKTIRRFFDLGSKPEKLIIWIGPAIAGCCYEVSPWLMKRFKSEFNRFEGFYNQNRLDLLRLNLLQAEEMGIEKSHISLAGLCTACQNHLFFSYRADGEAAGRLISSLMIM